MPHYQSDNGVTNDEEVFINGMSENILTENAETLTPRKQQVSANGSGNQLMTIIRQRSATSAMASNGDIVETLSRTDSSTSGLIR